MSKKICMPQIHAISTESRVCLANTLKQMDCVRPCSAVLAMEVIPPSGPVKAAKMSWSQSAATV